jgi:hypothetical protein
MRLEILNLVNFDDVLLGLVFLADHVKKREKEIYFASCFGIMKVKMKNISINCMIFKDN